MTIDQLWQYINVETSNKKAWGQLKIFWQEQLKNFEGANKIELFANFENQLSLLLQIFSYKIRSLSLSYFGRGKASSVSKNQNTLVTHWLRGIDLGDAIASLICFLQKSSCLPASNTLYVVPKLCFASLIDNVNVGSLWYHSLIVRLTKL